MTKEAIIKERDGQQKKLEELGQKKVQLMQMLEQTEKEIIFMSGAVQNCNLLIQKFEEQETKKTTTKTTAKDKDLEKV
jgi:cysteine sulfinate desulfinase/cysteine desulfurase-like protein